MAILAGHQHEIVLEEHGSRREAEREQLRRPPDDPETALEEADLLVDVADGIDHEVRLRGPTR